MVGLLQVKPAWALLHVGNKPTHSWKQACFKHVNALRSVGLLRKLLQKRTLCGCCASGFTLKFQSDWNFRSKPNGLFTETTGDSCSNSVTPALPLTHSAASWFKQQRVVHHTAVARVLIAKDKDQFFRNEANVRKPGLRSLFRRR